MRSAVTERIYKYLMYQEVDRIPDLEFGYWPQTVRRWSGEGLGLDPSDEDRNQKSPGNLDTFFRFDTYGHMLPGRTHMNPAFSEEVLERRGNVTVMRDTSGVVSERYLNDVEQSSIPHYVSFPVKTAEDWADIKRRYRFEDSTRIVRDSEINEARSACSEGKVIAISFGGFYGQLRSLMGFENLSYAFYDMPRLIHEIVERWAELCAQQLERLPEDIPVDWVSWWEDMAGKNGPLISPEVFREFLQPGYRRVMDVARKRGCVISDVDCDGNPRDIVGNWLDEGVNTMFPLEIQAGVDPLKWRKDFGRDLRLRGGINKYALVEGGKAVDRELERIKPLLEDGGYIPHLDHLVPPDVPYAHYCDYLDKKRKLIGR